MLSRLKRTGPILPPFNFNAPEISRFSPEVTGRLLLKSMCERLGWSSLAGKRLLDFGCGVRFAQTIFNLEIDVALYAGVDTNAAPIAWLKENLDDSRFRFGHIDMRHQVYNAEGAIPTTNALAHLTGFDAVCMFSVITHQAPAEAALIFEMLQPCAPLLYFTAFTNEDIETYVEADAASPRHLSTYSTGYLVQLLEKTGWRTDAVHPPSLFQQTAFICKPR